MNLLRTAAALGFLLGAGGIAALLLTPDRRGWARLARALLFGPWVVTVQSLLFDLLSIPLSLETLAGPWILLGPAGFFLLRGRAADRRSARPSGPGRSLPLLAAALFLIVAPIALLAPFPDGDALFNFAAHAKVFQTHRSLDLEALKNLWIPGHRGYPPLLPLAELPFLDADPREGWRMIALFKPIALLAFLLLCAERFEGSGRNPIGRFCLVAGTPILLLNAVHGGADLFFVAAFMLLLLEAERWREGEEGALPAVGVAASILALTKIEGLPILGVAVVFLLARRKGSPRARAVALALALLPVLYWLILQKIHGLTPFPPALAGGDLLGRMIDSSAKFGAILAQTTAYAWIPSNTAVPIPLPSFGLLWLVSAVLLVRALASPAWRRAALVPLAGGLAHAGLLISGAALRGEDLDWLQATAFDRLALQLIPWAVLALSLRRPATGRGPGIGAHSRGRGSMPFGSRVETVGSS